jgi:methylenetetrahydrofolate dehydrogenase (NADP+)/methenyltetrahydrofolate cyclohydrolase
MKIINCLAIKEKIKEQLIEEIKMLKKHNVVPTLAIIQIGNNNASNIYIRNKINLSKELNTKTLLFHFDENVQIETIQLKIDELNKNSDINGILIQLPLPKQINAKQLVNRVNPKKDVDCFTFENIGKL